MSKFKILTLDGGGIRGYFMACMLSFVESKLQERWGKNARISDAVDLVCGTSTGGIIALAIANRISMIDVCNFYEEDGKSIFFGSSSISNFLQHAFWGGKYNDSNLRNSLESVLGTKLMGESDCLLCIPTFDVTHNTYEIFKFDHKEGNLQRHNMIPCVDVALATSAAPSYFPIAEIQKENHRLYVDGGVWANNPSMIGYFEALQYFVGNNKSYATFDLLSLGTLQHSKAKTPFASRRRSVFRWMPNLFDLSIRGQSEFSDVFLSGLQHHPNLDFKYLRVEGKPLMPEHLPHLKLDSASPKSLALMKQYATDAYHQNRTNEFFENFWNTYKTYQTK